MTFHGRADWGAAPPKYPYEDLPKPVTRAFQHHSVTNTHASPARTLRAIQEMHQSPPRNWNDIAYNECDDIWGDSWDGRGADHVGGATYGWNGVSLSRCALGSFHLDVPSDELVDTLVAEYTRWVREGRLTVDFRLSGHRDEALTACPGQYLYAMLPRIRARVAANVTTPDPPDVEDPLMAAKDEILAAIDTLAIGTVQALSLVQAPATWVKVEQETTEWYTSTDSDGRPVRVAMPGPPVRDMLIAVRFLEPEPIRLTGASAYWFLQIREVPYQHPGVA